MNYQVETEKRLNSRCSQRISDSERFDLIRHTRYVSQNTDLSGLFEVFMGSAGVAGGRGEDTLRARYSN